jgi:chromosome segregation ATPase
MKKYITSLILVSLLVMGAAQAQPSAKDAISETRLMLSIIDERIALLREYIPKIEKKLKKSKEDYRKLLAKVPKGYKLMCGDSVSSSLEDQLGRYKADLKSLKKEKESYEASIKKTETEQGAAANP